MKDSVKNGGILTTSALSTIILKVIIENLVKKVQETVKKTPLIGDSLSSVIYPRVFSYPTIFLTLYFTNKMIEGKAKNWLLAGSLTGLTIDELINFILNTLTKKEEGKKKVADLNNNSSSTLNFISNITGIPVDELENMNRKNEELVRGKQVTTMIVNDNSKIKITPNVTYTTQEIQNIAKQIYALNPALTENKKQIILINLSNKQPKTAKVNLILPVLSGYDSTPTKILFYRDMLNKIII